VLTKTTTPQFACGWNATNNQVRRISIVFEAQVDSRPGANFVRYDASKMEKDKIETLRRKDASSAEVEILPTRNRHMENRTSFSNRVSVFRLLQP
jgi:hypothetical protein